MSLPDEVTRTQLSWPALDWAMGNTDRTQAYTLNLSILLEVPKVSPIRIRDALSELVKRHETLRTIYHYGPGARGGQSVRAVPAPDSTHLPLIIHESGTGDLANSIKRHSFDLDNELPFILEAARHEDPAKTRLRMSIDHIATDWTGAAIIRSDLATLVEGARPVAEAGLTPSQLAHWESSPAGLEWQREKIQTWREDLTRAIQLITTDNSSRIGPTPRQSTTPVQEHILVSSDLGADFSRVARAKRVFVPALVFACIARAHRHALGQRTFTAQALTSNRWSKKGQRSSAKLFMQAPIIVDRIGDGDIEDSELRATQAALLRATKVSYADPIGVRALIDELDADQVPGILGAYYNFTPVHQLQEDSLPVDAAPNRIECHGDAGLGPGFAYTVRHSPQELAVSLRHDPACIRPADAIALLNLVHSSGMELAGKAAAELPTVSPATTGP